MSKRQFSNIRGSGDVYSKFGIEGLQQRNKDNLLEIIGAVKEAAEAAKDVPPTTYQAMGSMFRSMGSALGSANMLGNILGTSGLGRGMYGMTSTWGRTLGGFTSQMMAPATVAVNQFMYDITKPMVSMAQAYGTGSAIGGIVGMVGGAAAGAYLGGGVAGAGIGAQLLGTFGSYLGAAVEMAITGPDPARVSQWVPALAREIQTMYSQGYTVGMIWNIISVKYGRHPEAAKALEQMGIYDVESLGRYLGLDPYTGPIPERTPRIGGAGGGGGHARKPRDRRLM